MAETAPQPGTKVTLAEIFERAGLAEQPEGSVVLRSLRRELQCYRFAQLYVKHHFNPVAAYAEFNPNRRQVGRSFMASKWMLGKDTGPRIAFHVRQMIQESTRILQRSGLLDVQELIDINQAIILADQTDLFEQVRDPVSGRLYTRYKALNQLTTAQRMSIRSIRLNKDGEVAVISTYSRFDAQHAQVELLELLAAKGGSDQNWMGKFNTRMERARERRIQMEIDAGRVVRLPGAHK